MRSAIIFCKAAVSLADCEQVGGFFAMAMLSAILAGSLQDFVNNSGGVSYARTFGPNWKKAERCRSCKTCNTYANLFVVVGGRGVPTWRNTGVQSVCPHAKKLA